MSKTLSESAAEILKASMNAGKEAVPAMSAEVQDLGGQAPGELPTAHGAAASAGVKEAPKPGVTGVPAEGLKKSAEKAEVVADEEKQMKAEETEVPAEEVVAEENTETAETVESTEEVVEEETVEPSEEEIVEAKKEMMKGMVAKHKGSMKEDVDALFNGESLSEDFRVKATLIFETAVQSRVEKILEDVLAENDELLTNAVDEIKTELSEQVDEYLNYVVEQWTEENKVAIETGLRAELVGDFISGLKNLFAEHYIEIPEEKVDVAEELANEVASLQEVAAAKDAQIASLTEEVNVVKKDKLIRLACEGLTEVQAGKMKSLAESVEFTTEGEFNNKLAIIRENYFPAKTNVTSEVKAIQETAVEEPEVEQINSVMKHYVNALSKTAPKA